MSKQIECVPNFSEGRDQALIDDVVSAVKSTKVLDVHSDPDHNRSVVTMVGSPSAITKAAFELTERAMQLLDIRQHKGVHPFIGVVDVIPFIPLQGVTESETIDLACGFGQELWDKLKLPVYFYGAAAKVKERKDLPNVRRGGFAALKREIDLPERRPDVGQGLHQTAGAVAVGVRDFLVAFNVNLDTRDVDLARSVAKNIREKDGGLPGVRALGVPLDSRGITQVTINLVDIKRTGLKAVFDEVKKWAKEYKVRIIESEVVGMLPQEALFTGMKEDLLLKCLPRVLPLN
ncbi:MAG: glutamate formimidoyltransferase [Candidatus Margulisiibacteriota bacterium]